ncbi:Glycosyl transferase family 2 [Chryseobacterium formosense]|uniref:glycosyltransferase family 2 protein n=1 Tax=Chryseobacterium formosense TaxID=236814 RepID=UPI000552C721|nr:glycosyltransferase family 2 protein [Chryseobacterium formosense]SFT33287.1 Glycosyl transferase family 2 [Chryseobacterium formosense]
MRFTIAIPAYKRKFLYECIHSILNQDFKNFELIIINDASPENLDEIVQQFNDDRIIYYKNSVNIGAENVVDNWNLCLSYAKGDYFMLMGDDDTMQSNYLSVFNDLINSNPENEVYHCRSFIINSSSEVIGLTPSWPDWESVYENMWHRMNKFRSQYVSDFVYKRESLIKTGGYYKLPLAWASDDITSYTAAADKGIVHTQEPVFCYRQSEFTISNSGSIDLKMNAIIEEERWVDSFLKNNLPDNYLDQCFYNMIKYDKDKLFLKKRIDTIAYNGFTKGYYLRDMIKFVSKKNNYRLSLQHLIYALILTVKKNRSKIT